MTRFNPLLQAFAVAAAAACLAGGAQAQTTGYGPTGTSFIPNTTQGYVGLSLGRSNYRVPTGLPGYAYDDNAAAFKLTTGAMVNRNFGVEFGYNYMGRIDRAGGTTKAQGLDLALVGNVPLGGDKFDLFAKLGTTYGWTRSSTAVRSGLTGGNENGFGVLYGVGAAYHFTPQLAGVLEWESRDFNFIRGRDAVRATTVGLRYSY